MVLEVVRRTRCWLNISETVKKCFKKCWKWATLDKLTEIFQKGESSKKTFCLFNSWWSCLLRGNSKTMPDKLIWDKIKNVWKLYEEQNMSWLIASINADIFVCEITNVKVKKKKRIRSHSNFLLVIENQGENYKTKKGTPTSKTTTDWYLSKNNC